MSRRCVFLDRDGTINEEVDFLRTPDELLLVPGAAQAIRKLNDRGIKTCIISNQSGVARGYLTEEELVPIHETLRSLLEAEGGAVVDRIYYCPHHPTEGQPPHNVACDCRKPGAGMLRRGERELNVDLKHSFVVGDRIVDIQAGKSVGSTTLLVLTGYGRKSVEQCRAAGVEPDFVTQSLPQAVDCILELVDKGDTE